MTTTRRSRRTSSITYHSNGRDYLAACIGWNPNLLEEWLLSHKVRPHLQLWYQTCITGKKRFNDAVEWINTGPDGYFYSSTGLEEDLLLSCLGEGNSTGKDTEPTLYELRNVSTVGWVTQDLWARTAWRIVHDNSHIGGVFGNATTAHPSAVYGFVIDALCLAFHSIAHRGEASVWYEIICGTLLDSDEPSSIRLLRQASDALEIGLDQLELAQEELQEMGIVSTLSKTNGVEL